MKALLKVKEGEGNLELKEVERPEIKPDEVLINIKAAGICGSDLQHYYSLHNITIPVILGHEFSGDIVEIGNEVEGWQVGERIVSETHVHICGQCYLCKSGNYHLCKERKGYGSSVNGAFTEYIAVPSRLLHRLPDSISYPEATVLQPAADIVHAVTTNTNIRPGDSVVVIGPGPMGLLSAQLAAICGAGQVIVTGLNNDTERMKIAREIGVDHIINVEKEDLPSRIEELTGGKGADVVLEASGSREAFYTGLAILAKKGQITIIGVPTDNVEVSLQTLQGKEQIIRTSIMSTWPDYEVAITLVKNKRLNITPLITHTLPLRDWAKGFDLALAKKACKVVFTP